MTFAPAILQMRQLLVFVLITAACARPSTQRQQTAAIQPTQVQTIESVDPRPKLMDPPPVLQEEAAPPRPTGQPWEVKQPVLLTPEDEKLRASLPFTPAIAMDPIDGSKITIRASTPIFEYKGRIYYFQTEANKQQFAANPEAVLKGGMMRL
jgi:YHS domain-containing protein